MTGSPSMTMLAIMHYSDDGDDDDERIPYKELGLTAPVTLSAIYQLTHTGKFNKKSADKITNFNPSTNT